MVDGHYGTVVDGVFTTADSTDNNIAVTDVSVTMADLA